jgi:hypothetical protein
VANKNANTAVGAHAGAYNPGSSGCIYIGFRSGWKSAGGVSNIYMGSYAGESNTGDFNVAIGQQALRNNTNDFNVALGNGTLEGSVSGNQNTAVGALSSHLDTSGINNTAVGFSSFYSHLRNNANTAIGVESLRSDTTGAKNVAVGYQSMYYFQGNNNTALGTSSLDFNGSGSNNTAIGFSADVGVDDVDYATAIGASSRCDTSNSIVLGKAGINVSIGTNKPLSRMDVNGSIGSGIRTITGNATASVTDHTIIISSTVGTGAVDITLPNKALCTRREYRIVNQSVSTNKSISTYTDFTGASVTTLPSNNAIILQSDGVEWIRVR